MTIKARFFPGGIWNTAVSFFLLSVISTTLPSCVFFGRSAPDSEDVRAGSEPDTAPQTPVKSEAAGKRSETKPTQTGQASWYGPRLHGKKTASGSTFDQTEFTAAHRHLPFGSRVKVTNLDNGKSVEVEITDRGPYAGNRIIDVSKAAAKALEMKEKGTIKVIIEHLSESSD